MSPLKPTNKSVILQSVQVQNKATDAAGCTQLFRFDFASVRAALLITAPKTGVSDICFVGIAPPLLSCSPIVETIYYD